jgi:RimJ/RimL family protein N-acetyltransferase
MIDDFQIKEYEFINYFNLSAQLQRQVYEIRISDSIRTKMVNPEIFSYEEHIAFVNSLINNDVKSYWAICKNNMFYASINLHPVNCIERWAEWGIFINPKYEGLGIAKIISCLFLEYVAKYTSLEQIKAKVKVNNLNSIYFHHRIGFSNISTDNVYLYMAYRLIK